MTIEHDALRFCIVFHCPFHFTGEIILKVMPRHRHKMNLHNSTS